MVDSHRGRTWRVTTDMSKQLYCTKHGCVLTQTITDSVFCGVCRTHELKEILRAVDAEFKKHGNNFPDGFDSRVFRWVESAIGFG